MFFILLLPKFLILLTKSQNCKIFWILTFYFLINIYYFSGILVLVGIYINMYSKNKEN